MFHMLEDVKQLLSSGLFSCIRRRLIALHTKPMSLKTSECFCGQTVIQELEARTCFCLLQEGFDQ